MWRKKESREGAAEPHTDINVYEYLCQDDKALYARFLNLHACVCVCVSACKYLFQQEGRCSKGEGPAVAIMEELLRLSWSIHHFIINAGDVQDQTNYQTEACTHRNYRNNILLKKKQSIKCVLYLLFSSVSIGMQKQSCTSNKCPQEEAVVTHTFLIYE